MAVVKANAYGHGTVRVAETCIEAGAEQLAVARLAEGAALREAGIKTPILVLGAPDTDALTRYAQFDLSVTASSARVVAALASARTPLRVHLKVDTGMGRLGCSPADAPALLEQLQAASHLKVDGLWTHFATADEPDSAYAREQLQRFQQLRATLQRPHVPVHLANSAALLYLNEAMQQTEHSLVRAGLSLYGVPPAADAPLTVSLRPVMRLSAPVVHLKTVSPGTSISYGARWTASRPTRIATLGVGYGDGYPRLCSKYGRVRINDTLRPFAGTICMDMCMVDLGRPEGALAQRVHEGDTAVLFDAEGPTAHDVATWARTIPYEIFCRLDARVPRNYVA